MWIPTISVLLSWLHPSNLHFSSDYIIGNELSSSLLQSLIFYYHYKEKKLNSVVCMYFFAQYKS